MVDWLWGKTGPIATRNGFWVLLIYVIVFTVLFQFFGADYPEPSFDAHRYGVRAADIPRILQDFDAHQQLDCYLTQETTLDLLYPAIYGLFFAVCIVRIRPKRWRWLIVIPYAAGVFDYCENATFIALVLGYQHGHPVSPALAIAATVASHLKWAFLL
ncbi:MAG TPA: hypothetical protein VG323_00195, partial [Thermoanaerobaculia bacterium]|nr:hypothetical protein [Thermoanaerobaculia bacterium]